MRFLQMKEAFETYTGTTDGVDNAQLALWFNEAQLDLAYELGQVKSVSLQVEANESYQPGDGWLVILGSELEYHRELDGSLTFPAGGSGRLYYREMPADFTGANGDQESELPVMLHYLPVLFATSRYWDTESEGDGEESALASKWLSYYYQGKNLARSRMAAAGFDINSWKVV